MVFKKKRRSVRHYFSKARRGVKHGFGSGIIGDMVTGGIVGAVTQFAAPTINKKVPSVLGLRPTTAVVLGVGALDKLLIHKGGKFSSAAIIIGTAMAAGDLMANMGGATTNINGGAY